MFTEYLPVPGAGLSLGDTREEVTRKGKKACLTLPARPDRVAGLPSTPCPEKPPPRLPSSGGLGNYNIVAAPGAGGSAPHAGSTTESGITSPLEPNLLGSAQSPPTVLCLSFPGLSHAVRMWHFPKASCHWATQVTPGPPFPTQPGLPSPGSGSITPVELPLGLRLPCELSWPSGP